MIPAIKRFGTAALGSLAALGLVVPQARAQFRGRFPVSARPRS
jgi:hypothetical protein